MSSDRPPDPRTRPEPESSSDGPAGPGRADKPALRVWARSLAAATDGEHAAVRARLAALPAVTEATCVCVFLAIPGEVDLSGLPSRLTRPDWVTTRTPDDPGDRFLTVHPLDAPRELHRFGYPQPVATSPTVAPGRVDAWLVPGLAFDPAGNRLGHGAGYYDRLLARAARHATIVGVTLERRLVGELPREPHDRTMDLVVTEARTVVVDPA